MIDPTGVAISLLRSDLGVAAITSRVRGAQPAPGDEPPFVVVARATTSRNPGGGQNQRAGLQEVYLQVKAFGATPMQAAQLYGACSDALHHHSPYVDSNGRALLLINDDVGVSPGTDPGTGWPYEDGTMRVLAGAGAVPGG